MADEKKPDSGPDKASEGPPTLPGGGTPKPERPMDGGPARPQGTIPPHTNQDTVVGGPTVASTPTSGNPAGRATDHDPNAIPPGSGYTSQGPSKAVAVSPGGVISPGVNPAMDIRTPETTPGSVAPGTPPGTSVATSPQGHQVSKAEADLATGKVPPGKDAATDFARNPTATGIPPAHPAPSNASSSPQGQPGGDQGKKL